jgi:hypothetical protein
VDPKVMPNPATDPPALALPRQLSIPAAARPGAKTEGVLRELPLLMEALLELPLPLLFPLALPLPLPLPTPMPLSPLPLLFPFAVCATAVESVLARMRTMGQILRMLFPFL